VAYSPLGRGFLTGQFKSPEDIPAGDYRKFHPRFMGENFYKNLELVKKVEEMAREKQVTPSQIALAWVMNQGDDIVPIPGTRHVKRLQENMAAVDITLSRAEMQKLDQIFIPGHTSGARYADMSTVNR
jgi:aryl-alcohol dehydrogenase-like predicted oxidoreductase